MSVLRDILVLELAEGIAGPVCGLQLADFGATVIKVEPPGGDRCREWGPPMIGDDAAVFVHLNRGKRSVVLDPAGEAGRAALERLLRQADVLVVQMDPVDRARAGFDWDAVCARQPRLLICEISGMGDRGPLADDPASELVCQAMSGMTRYIGAAGGEPCRIGFEVAGMAAGMLAYQAILAGLLWRERSGKGQVVRLSQLGSLVSMKTIQLAAQSGFDAWKGFHLLGPLWPPDTGWQTRDGQVTFEFRRNNRSGWVEFCRRVGLGHLADDPAYADWTSTFGLGDRREDLGAVYRPVFARMTCEEAASLINGLGGMCVKLHDYAEFLAHPQLRALNALVRVPGERPGAQLQVGAPFTVCGLEAPADLRRAPGPGEHTREVLSGCGLSDDEIDRLEQESAAAWRGEDLDADRSA